MVNISNNPNPEYSNQGDAGMDIRAFVDSPIVLLPHRRVLVSTGISIDLPKGVEGQIRGRSGLAIKHGVTTLGTGTVDPSYKGDIGVILINQGSEAFVINNGDRIAQLVVSKFEKVDWEVEEELVGEDRGGGFGSTGVK